MPWKLVYSLKLETKTKALKFERKLKSLKSSIYLGKIINNGRIAQLARAFA